MVMVAGGPRRRRQQARLTGEKRDGRGRWPRRLGRRRDYQGERETDKAQGRPAPAGNNDHGDSERGGRSTGRQARVQVPALRREPWKREAGSIAEKEAPLPRYYELPEWCKVNADKRKTAPLKV